MAFEIKFSRHAKRRAKLYKIPEHEITSLLKNLILPEGEHQIIRNLPDFDLPIKIVITVENNLMTIVTCYPLKKAYNNESLL